MDTLTRLRLFRSTLVALGLLAFGSFASGCVDDDDDFEDIGDSIEDAADEIDDQF
jgi:hypothetical protein